MSKDDASFSNELPFLRFPGVQDVLDLSFQNQAKFRIERELGRGGMGVVYLAYDYGLQREVAIKMILESEHSKNNDGWDKLNLLRLKEEARYGAGLRHQNIVNVINFLFLDDGWEKIIEVDNSFQFDASPIACLVMDFIDGCRLSAFSLIGTIEDATFQQQHVPPTIEVETSVADSVLMEDTIAESEATGRQVDKVDEAAGFQTTRESLKVSAAYTSRVVEICADVADALAEAHRNDVWHNDITPKNVMVDRSGKAWLTDFGLAESSFEAGRSKKFRGTCGYAAPESVHGERGPRSDIFSLGATLYQLLTFERVYEISQNVDLLSFAKNYQTPNIRNANPNLSADLCAVISTALAFDPEDRYQDAGKFRDDLKACLANEPVSVREQNWAAHLMRWSKNNPVLTAVSCLLLVAITAGAAVSLWQASVAKGEARKAIESANAALAAKKMAVVSEKRAVDTLSVMIDSFEAANPEGNANEQTPANEVLKLAFEHTKSSELDDAGKLSVFHTLSNLLLLTGASELSLESAELAHELGKTVEVDARTRRGLNLRLANSLQENGKYEQAAEIYETQRQIDTENGSADNVVETEVDLAVLYRKMGQTDQAIGLSKKCMDFLVDKHGGSDPKSLTAEFNYAICLRQSGRFQEAAEILIPNAESRKTALGLDHPGTLKAMTTLANNFSDLDQLDESIRIREEMAETLKTKLGNTHPQTLRFVNALVIDLLKQRKFERALKIQEKVVLDCHAELPEDHPQTLNATSTLGGAYFKNGKHLKALEVLETVEASQRRVLPENHTDILSTQNTIAVALLKVGEFQRAMKVADRNLEAARKTFGPVHPKTLNRVNTLAAAMNAAGEYQAAADKLQQTIDDSAKSLGRNHSMTQQFLKNQGVLLRKAGQPAKAAVCLEEVVRNIKSLARLVEVRRTLRVCYIQSKQPQKYWELASKELDELRLASASDSKNVPRLEFLLLKVAQGLTSLGQLDEAEKLAVELIGRLEDRGEGESLSLWSAKALLGRLAVERKQFEDARMMLETCFDKLQTFTKPEKDLTEAKLMALDSLVAACEGLERNEELGKWKLLRADIESGVKKD